MSARLNDPAAIRASIDHIEKVSGWLQRALWSVMAGAITFTTSTVTYFGIHHQVAWYIAWLLEPLVAIALIAVLLGDGVLSNYGQKAPGWATLLRWFAGLASWTMNVWQSIFRTNAKGEAVGFHPDVAGIVLHSIVPLLVILLAESAPRYRRRFSIISEQLKDRLAKLETRPTTPAKPLTDRVTKPAVPAARRATEPLAVPPTKSALDGSVVADRAMTVPPLSHSTEPAAAVTAPTTKPSADGTVTDSRANQASTESDSDGMVPPELRPGVTPPDFVIDAARMIYERSLNAGKGISDRKLAVATRDHFNVPYAVIGRSACQKVIADVERAEETG